MPWAQKGSNPNTILFYPLLTFVDCTGKDPDKYSNYGYARSYSFILYIWFGIKDNLTLILPRSRTGTR